MLPVKPKSPSGRFNGTVQTDEGPVEVREGFAVIDGALFMISDDGVLITDQNGNVVAIVSNGKARELTPEIINQLRSRGYIK